MMKIIKICGKYYEDFVNKEFFHKGKVTKVTLKSFKRRTEKYLPID